MPTFVNDGGSGVPSFVTKWGQMGESDGRFVTPQGVAVDSSGNVYVTDELNHRIQKFDSDGTFITEWGSEGEGYGQFNTPMGVAVDSSDNVYIGDGGNNRIQKFDSEGTFITEWGSEGEGNGEFGNGEFRSPTRVAVDSSNNVYVVDTANHRIQKFSSSGTFMAKWGRRGYGDGEFRGPTGVAVDSSNNVYVAEQGNNRIQKFG